MSDQGPLSGSEECMTFHVRCACAGSKSAILVFDQELTDQGFAKAVTVNTRSYENAELAYLDI